MDRRTRRAQLERMKARARLIYPQDPQAYKLANHLAFCHNFCCQEHRRKFSGRTLREIRFADR
jgi:hypothetical protein